MSVGKEYKMRKTERDLLSYQKEYNELPFEDYQVQFRRRKVLEHLEARRPECVVEIGCGNEPLFKNVPEVKEWIVVEPGTEFFEKAKAAAPENVILFNEYFEDSVEKILHLNKKIDYIVCSALLHELEKPEELLAGIRKLCMEHTIVHINVSNARSLHRILAVEMGLISDVYTQSEQQKRLQQSDTVYDLMSLKAICEDNGFEVVNEGSYFVKPFTHRQMQQCLDDGIFGMDLLEGLDRLIKYMPEYGSEIFVECRRK